MKISRIFLITLALITCLSLFACRTGGAKDETSDTARNTESTEAEKETEPMQFSEYYMITDSDDLRAARDDLKSMIALKYGVEPSGNYGSGIRLTSDGATKGKISARLEGSELVIRAASAEEMKKAVTCFWYENIAYVEDKVDFPADFTYERNLSDVVFYSDFGAVGAEDECCLDSLISAHDYANEHGLKVFADYGAKYYIASTGKTAYIKTDVEWGDAEFTIDDSVVTPENRGNWIFSITSDLKPYDIVPMLEIDRNVTNLGITLDKKSIVTITDNTKKQYIRKGGNANDGQAKRDTVVVDVDGSIDMNAPLMWDFDSITSVSARPIDETKITVSGGTFTTIANKAPSEYTYYARGLSISRSNVTVSHVKHYVTGEGPTGAPYNGFFTVGNCAYVNIENCVLTGHKTYQSPTTAMGSYDFGASNAVSVTLKNCTQSNDINDSKYWGVMGTNYCKNLIYDGCSLSRFDAHAGVANAAIKNSTIGHGGATIIGYGTMLVENSTFYGKKMLELRYDYGSSWEGDIIIRNCKLYCGSLSNCSIITANNTQDHDFGYTCYMPKNVIIDGLYTDTQLKTYVFSVKSVSPSGETPFPYIPTESVTVKGFSALGNQPIQLSPQSEFLSNTEFTVQ